MMNSNHDRICTLPKPPVFLNLPPNATCRQRLICKIRWMMLPCEWHHGSAELIRSRKNLLLERRRQLLGHWIIWHPFSAIKFYWDCFFSAIMFAVFMYMPFQVFLICPSPHDGNILSCDVIAFVDICVTFITGYTDDDNKRIVIEPKLIAKNYLKGTFVIDLIAALPFQLFSLFKNCKLPTHTVMYVLKVPRLFAMDKKWKNIRKQLGLSYIKAAVVTVFFRSIIFFHWMTFIHYQVPVLCSHLYAMDFEWMERFRSVWKPFDMLLRKYTANLYLTCGLCVGTGYFTPISLNYIPELLITSFIGVAGLFFFIYCFTTLLRIIMYVHQETFRYHGRVRELENYMELKRLPITLRKKVLLYLNYEFSGGYFNEDLILNTINEQIKQDINMHSCKRLVDNVPMFNGLPVALTNTIIFSLTRVFYMPGETIIDGKKPLNCMIFVYSGSVVVMNWAGKEITHLKDGSFYGEIALLEPGLAREVSLIALEITEIYTLTSDQLQRCVLPFPHLRRRLIPASRARPSPTDIASANIFNNINSF